VRDSWLPASSKMPVFQERSEMEGWKSNSKESNSKMKGYINSKM
jgi:hypothetical protein